MTMPCLRARSFFSSPFPITLSAPKHTPHLKLPFPTKTYFRSSQSRSSITMSSSTTATTQTIEHVVLFKVKDGADPSQVSSMVNGLNGLISLDHVVHLTAGPLLLTRSSLFSFTHMLHSRYNSKDDLCAYSAHPDHLRVVKESIFPICDDIMAVDWIADHLPDPLAPSPGSAVKVTFLKLKENLGHEVKDEILGVIKGIKDDFAGIDQITCGENFSPARAKGFSVASIAFFKDLSEMEALDSKDELVNLQKEKVRDHLESVIVVDYVVPSSSQSSSL